MPATTSHCLSLVGRGHRQREPTAGRVAGGLPRPGALALLLPPSEQRRGFGVTHGD